MGVHALISPEVIYMIKISVPSFFVGALFGYAHARWGRTVQCPRCGKKMVRGRVRGEVLWSCSTCSLTLDAEEVRSL